MTNEKKNLEEERRSFAVYVITKHGLKTACLFKKAHPECDLYVSKRLFDQAPVGSKLLQTPMGPTLRETWKQYNCHLHIISVGAVVRMIAPLLENKKVDPAVVCVDDANQFSICLLSGHVGRGNEFTKTIGQALGNQPVITTASDATGTLTVDILGRDLGWVLDDKDRNVTLGCAAVVNQSKVAFIQETGEPHFWPLQKKLPPGVEYFTSKNKVNPEHYEMLLVCTDKNFKETHPKHWEKAVIYRPQSLVLGLGCDKNAPFEVIEKGVLHHLEKEGLGLKSVKAIATIDLKLKEEAFIKLSQKYGWELLGTQHPFLIQLKELKTQVLLSKNMWGQDRWVKQLAFIPLRQKNSSSPNKNFNLKKVEKI